MNTVKVRLYYIVSIISLFVAVVGFSYNTWRLEVSEENNTVRTAAFEVFNHLAELEQVIYAAHYDQNLTLGSPRKGWVKVGVIVDLSSLMPIQISEQANQLKVLWQEQWPYINDDEQAVNSIIEQIDRLRAEIKTMLANLP